ncbi:hypothetical protein [Zooshikella sp. RANM57]|uniref:hypothetical protein n=1 Tax=Zooshikella sp. RANM57 TaxID=3425863 RepID=UPI003D6E4B9E
MRFNRSVTFGVLVGLCLILVGTVLVSQNYISWALACVGAFLLSINLINAKALKQTSEPSAISHSSLKNSVFST